MKYVIFRIKHGWGLIVEVNKQKIIIKTVKGIVKNVKALACTLHTKKNKKISWE